MQAFIAVNRFGLGAAPGELAAAGREPRRWLERQILAPLPAHPELAQLTPSGELVRELVRFRTSLRQSRRAAKEDGMGEAQRSVETSFRDQFFPILAKDLGARIAIGARTEAPFHERLVWFWSNHFTVSAQKPAVFPVAGAFEREAIRPHVSARFVDLLLAAVKHPAMILYLDNNLSRAGGLNENLAREILELHTLGVAGGYTQADVTTFARALTGWTVAVRDDGGFRFVRRWHEHGPKTLLGKTYAQEGVAQGEAMLRELAAHPSTAKHLATKLARHFIADEPPQGAVERIARAYRESGGELRAVYAALLDSPEAWATPLAKVKQPMELVVSVLRALPFARGAKVEGLFVALNEMGQRPWFAPSPQGWPDKAEAWLGADNLWKRIEWAGAVATRTGSRIDPVALAEETYGEAVSESTRLALERAESRQQGLALWLASPEFQRR